RRTAAGAPIHDLAVPAGDQRIAARAGLLPGSDRDAPSRPADPGAGAEHDGNRSHPFLDHLHPQHGDRARPPARRPQSVCSLRGRRRPDGRGHPWHPALSRHFVDRACHHHLRARAHVVASGRCLPIVNTVRRPPKPGRIPMPMPSRRTALTIACALFAVHPALAETRAPIDDMALAAALRGGGLVILLRHGATFTDQADTDPFNFDNVSAQRQLNEAGKAHAEAFGEALRQAGVSVGKAYTSKFNRAYQTAALAGFTDIERTADLTEGGLVVPPAENARRAEALRKLLAKSPERGPNTV